MLKVAFILFIDFMLRSVNAIVAFHIETSHLICTANQMTDFFMKCNAWLVCVKLFPSFFVNFFHSRYIFFVEMLEAQSEVSHTSQMKLFVKIVND